MTDHWGDFDFDHHDLPHETPDDPHADLHDADAALPLADHGLHDPSLHDLSPHDPSLHDAPGFDGAGDPALGSITSDDPLPLGDDLFPPALQVGELPEPVDGFPWIDTATLGTPDDTGFAPALDPVTPDELAAYAHTSGPADWAALADSDDPATSALARWWTLDEQ
ncbi:hypothetical protein AMIS_41480 [Actinoplanes missouriensis 431]|uniref:Uncharacterized protein n=1 Tax=Actinoplanes missouriensis (strain ATCC 14538 / DSM 43046 / CBS 188.64 / JCM 3121 / NBRC 102363 / NCIMB 12654 / NRRL B-3342 / UNCC 431) TaxID=512565 RepID=I0H8N1_ACTM4|nr:hypothetical protein [Actinoplanes missouriensis]BAL89368.1 hypothetical protein AMIS_41480 [Actinoplanes missouriensis 431]